jgi:hypothetical protein
MTTTKKSTAVRLFHRTTAGAARCILAEGFRDGVGTYLTQREWRGVWLSEDPDLGSQEVLAEEDVLLQVDLDVEATALDEFEWVEEGKPYREWLVPSEFIRKCGRVSLVPTAESEES